MDSIKHNYVLVLLISIVLTIIILLVGLNGLSKIALYFCIPALIIAFLVFLFYACIIYPLESKDKVKKIGYKKCVKEGLDHAMLDRARYLKIATSLCVIMIITSRTISFYFVIILIAMYNPFSIYLLYEYILRPLFGKKPSWYEVGNKLPQVSEKLLSFHSELVVSASHYFTKVGSKNHPLDTPLQGCISTLFYCV